MAELTVANYLAALQDDPWAADAFEGLAAALRSNDRARTGDDPVRLLEFARRSHEVRGETFAAAKLIEQELTLTGSDPEFAAVLWRELGRLRREDLMDDAGALEAYEKALAISPSDEDVQRAIDLDAAFGLRELPMFSWPPRDHPELGTASSLASAWGAMARRTHREHPLSLLLVFGEAVHQRVHEISVDAAQASAKEEARPRIVFSAAIADLMASAIARRALWAVLRDVR